jgi:hypothetical protein
MEQHVNMPKVMAKKLDAIKACILDEVKVMILLITFPKSYQHLIIALESLKSKDRT